MLGKRTQQQSYFDAIELPHRVCHRIHSKGAWAV